MTAIVGPEPIDAADLVRAVAGSGRGGTAVFLGTVRQGPDDGAVQAIDYSAYDEMASAELARILNEAAIRWPDGKFAARHRTGRVELGEASIGVAAALPHRTGAFEACRWIVEEAKRRLPIWKKERFADGTASWREHRSGTTPASPADQGR